MDQGFTGEIQVLLHNRNKFIARISQRTAIAQAIIEVIHNNLDISEVDKLPKFDWNKKAFGSSNIKQKINKIDTKEDYDKK